MSKVIKIKRGLDIKLKGTAEKLTVTAEKARYFAVKPPDFTGLTPKLCVKPGEKVKAGTAIFYDKYQPDVKFVSPVSGLLKEVVRGERRRIMEVLVESDDKYDSESFQSGNPSTLDASIVKETLLKSGLWPAIIQRPYGVIANPDNDPNGIFISAFDSAPLAPDYDVILRDEGKNFAAGVAALQKLTTGKVHLSVEDGYPTSKVFLDLPDVEYHSFKGPHPAGNTGIQIHHVSPINKGDIYWTVRPQLVSLIGRLFLTGKFDPSITIGLAGSRVSKPRYFKTQMGSQVSSFLAGQLLEGNTGNRIISGNVLTGTSIEPDGYLGFYDSVVSVIPEGDYYEMFGWILPGLKKFSNSRSFPSWLQPNKDWEIDTNLKGGKRAFVMTGQYEKVLPMDILPVHLLKSILVEDIDKMEQLGIYEVLEEDLALCEFVCTSKTEVQEILRRGLDLMQKEMS